MSPRRIDKEILLNIIIDRIESEISAECILVELIGEFDMGGPTVIYRTDITAKTRDFSFESTFFDNESSVFFSDLTPDAKNLCYLIRGSISRKVDITTKGFSDNRIHAKRTDHIGFPPDSGKLPRDGLNVREQRMRRNHRRAE